MPYLPRGIPLSITKRWISGFIMLFVCTLCVSGPALAKSRAPAPHGQHYRVAEVDGAAAARIVERSTGGKVLSVLRQENKGRIQYRVKVLLPEGRVRTVNVDAQTGQMSG